MKQLFVLSLCLMGFFLSAEAQERLFSVRFIQDGQKVPLAENNTVNLKKKPFQIQLSHILDEGVLIGATFDKDLYRSAMGDADLEVMWFSNTGMADDMFNDDKSLMMSDEAPSYWFYTSKEQHRFDHDPKESNGRYLGTRTIENLALLDPYRMVPIKNVKKNLYLVFYESSYDAEEDEIQTVTNPLGFQIVWVP
ncbi:hypothetical protein [Sphingobacterium sp. MYb382]|uniref:hypothetical protein n=1 Tax=Sphingobacterium sp. MYb382 TaxID=2745278 RepID=UPI0030A6CAD7